MNPQEATEKITFCFMGKGDENKEKKNKLKISVVGPRGYTGAETIKILSLHPCVDEIQLLTLSEDDKQKEEQTELEITRAIPSFRKYLQKVSKIEKFSEERLEGSDAIFFCTEQNKAHKIVSRIVELGISSFIIDLSPDFRFKDVEQYKKVYSFDHAIPSAIQKTAYGLTELYREKIKGSEIVANPGCYPTATLLATAPLINYAKKQGLIIEWIIVDAKSGVTGAGRKALPHLTLAYLSENIKVYAWSEHRHVPEMQEKLKELFDISPPLNFTAQLIPAKRGILETIWIKLDEKPEPDKVFEEYQNFSLKNFFFDFWGEELPDIYSVTGTNFIRVGIRCKDNIIMLVSVLDNLIKGASGQAVQNLNIKFGYDEKAGLELPPIFT